MMAAFVILIITQAATFGQGTGPQYPLSNANPVINVNPAASPTATDDYLFGWSGYTTENVLVLNGIPVPYTDQGWYTQSGEHGADNDNYFCGTQYYTEASWRNYYTFDLDDLSSFGITPPITTAVLKIQLFYAYPSTPKLYELSQVTTPLSVINQNYGEGSATGQAIWADLGDGTSYASFLVDRSQDINYVIEIPLNSSAALAGINAAVGTYFTIGGKCDNMEPEAVPVSNWALGIGITLILAVAIFRFRRMV